MFRSIFLKTFRDYRWAVLGWGIGMGLIMVELIAGVSAILSTPEQRAQLAQLASQMAWNADATGADTPGGYATWKLGTFIFIVCIWPLLAASRTLRGEEETSRLDVLLSAPRSRVNVALQKIGAIWIALILIGLIMAVMTFLPSAKFNANISLGNALLFGLNVSLICMVIAGVALVLAQFTQERSTAAGITGALLVMFIVVDMVHRVVPGTSWLSQFSPVYWYNMNKPLVPGFSVNLAGFLLELGVAVVLTVGGIGLFVRRDVGDVIALPGWMRRLERPRPASHELPVGDWTLGTAYARSLGMIAAPTVWWTLGMAAFGAWLVVLIEQMASNLQKLMGSSDVFKRWLDSFGGPGAAFNDTLLSFVFFFMPIFIMGFAVTQVNRWRADEDDGRLEILLSTPQTRQRVILGRFAALATSAVIISAVTLVAIVVVGALAGVSLDGGHIAAATLGLIPMALFVAAIGYLFAGWLATAADTGLLSFLLAAWFFLTFIGPELKLPDALMRLSPFYYYGTPVVHGFQVDVLVLVAVGAVALALATLRFARKDIAA